jgi:fumarate reductase subunit C
MNAPAARSAPPHTPYHPRWYRARVSTYWWMHQWPYFRFVLRELTSLGVAYSCVILLCLIRALSLGPDAYQVLQKRLASPVVVLLTVISLLLVLFHTITWFRLSAHAMVVRVGGKRIPGALISASNYVAWLVVSGLLAWLLLR